MGFLSNSAAWSEPREESRLITPVHQARNVRNFRQVVSACLLVALISLPPYLYFHWVFQVRHLESPSRDLLVVHKDDPAELAFFRKKTVPDFIDPTLQRLQSTRQLQWESSLGQAKPKDFGARKRKLDAQLQDIVNAAKLRQIPAQYQERYFALLAGIADTYYSLDALEEAVLSRDKDVRASAFRRSLALSTLAERKLLRSREYFYVR